MSHSFWTSYFGLLAMWVFDLIILFLNWTLISFLCFICFCFVLWWLRAPKKILADFCKTWFVLFIFLKLSIYSYLFIQIYLYIYIYTYVYVYINIYLHMCIYICVCVCKFMYLYIYIYVCVGGLSQNEVSFFPLKEPFLEPKNTSFWDISMYIQYIYFLTCVFLFLSCVGLSHAKYMVFVFLLYVVFSASFYRKNVSNQRMFHWRLQYR